MTLLHHLDIWFERYLALCAVAILAWCFAVPRLKARQRVLRISPPYPANVPVPAPLTPPFSQTVPSADWFWGIPSDCLSDDAVHSLFDDVVRGEFA